LLTLPRGLTGRKGRSHPAEHGPEEWTPARLGLPRGIRTHGSAAGGVGVPRRQRPVR